MVAHQEIHNVRGGGEAGGAVQKHMNGTLPTLPPSEGERISGHRT